MQGISQKLEKLDAFIDAIFRMFALPGLAIAVTDKRERIYLKSAGVLDTNTQKPLMPHAIFHMASISKTLTATAVLQLAEQGKLELDGPIVACLPYFRLNGLLHREITVRQVLNHTSGMPDVRDYQWSQPQCDDGAAERYVRGLASEQMISPPGERYRYSDMAYNVLADLVAKASGQTFEGYVQDRILQPLGMSRSSFLLQNHSAALCAMPHLGEEEVNVSHVDPVAPPAAEAKIVVGETYPYNRIHAASSTLSASVWDMCNWLLVNLNQGTLRDFQVLSAPTHASMLSPSIEVRKPLENESHACLGWFMGVFGNVPVVGHLGHDPGYWSRLMLLPAQGLGVIVASNYDLAPMVLIQNVILAVLTESEARIPAFLKNASKRIQRLEGRAG